MNPLIFQGSFGKGNTSVNFSVCVNRTTTYSMTNTCPNYMNFGLPRIS